ncbi:MAG: hypothetical protein MRJ96_05890 [Nitrospirales bacterium]|nr:hypothetical protein [Nitrospira sp.]MDR4500965.1 hypothetical protein [Nitrospirales bacterium]
MNNGLTLLGLSLSTGGALLLLTFDIRERTRKSLRTQKLADITNELKSWQRNLTDAIKSVARTNERLGYEAYSEEKETGSIRKKLDSLQEEREKLDDLNFQVLEDIPPLTHPIAYVLLVMGFLFQMLALEWQG